MNAMITMIVPSSLVEQARQSAANASPAGVGMFITALAPSASAQPTHYISTGAISNQFLSLLSDADLLAEVGGISKTDAQSLVDQSVVVDLKDESPRETLARLGLVVCEADE